MRPFAIIVFLAASQLFAQDLQQIREFVLSSVEPDNASFLGFRSVDEAQSFVLGPVIQERELDNDLLGRYPASDFSIATGMSYAPILINGEARCFVVIDQKGRAVSLGYRQLAEDLNQLARQFALPLEEIVLYSSRQINSYLVSIPTRAVAAAYGSSDGVEKNLLILNAEWKKGVASAPMAGGGRGVLLPTERETIEWIKAMGGR